MTARFTILALLATCRFACADGKFLASVSLQMEPVDRGSQVATVLFAPARSESYTQIVFESVYQQTLPFQDSTGQQRLKTMEPVRHSYRRTDVKLVNDLGKHISFRVPLDLAKLNTTYGPDTFDPAYPVKIDRIIITAHSTTGVVWSCSVKPGETLAAPSAATPPHASDKEKPPVDAAFGEVDLD